MLMRKNAGGLPRSDSWTGHPKGRQATGAGCELPQGAEADVRDTDREVVRVGKLANKI